MYFPYQYRFRKAVGEVQHSHTEKLNSLLCGILPYASQGVTKQQSGQEMEKDVKTGPIKRLSIVYLPLYRFLNPSCANP